MAPTAASLRGEKKSLAVTGAGSAGVLHLSWQGTSASGGAGGWHGPPGRQGEALAPGFSRESSRAPPWEGNWGQKGVYLSVYWIHFYFSLARLDKNSLGF